LEGTAFVKISQPVDIVVYLFAVSTPNALDNLIPDEVYYNLPHPLAMAAGGLPMNHCCLRAYSTPRLSNSRGPPLNEKEIDEIVWFYYGRHHMSYRRPH